MNILLVGRQQLKFGGPSIVMSNLKKKINKKEGIKVEIFDIQKINSKNFFQILYSKKFEEYLFKFDLIHFHELWSLGIIIFAIKSQRLGVPYIFTFHGVLNRWSLKKNYYMKKIFLEIFSKYIFKVSHALHFLSKKELEEAENLSRYINQKSFILNNGIVINNLNLKKSFNQNNYLNLLFFGRIHPKKGIIDLIYAFRFIKKDNLNIKLKIVGPNSEHAKYVISKIQEFDLNDHISLHDPVYNHDEKKKIFQEADFFVLPSYDEADSVALKESISFGVPVIITDDCKFDDPEKLKIGFKINHNHEDIYKKIKKINFDKSTYMEMSNKCHKFAKNNFDLESIVNEYIELTKEIVSGVQYSDKWL